MELAMNKARVKKVLVALVVFLVVIQIFQPRRTNPPAVPSRSLTAHVHVPNDVYSALIRSCGDCHSNETRWPWYSNIAPLSWVITDDVNEGRRHMNIEDWDSLEDPKQANDRLVGICEEIKQKGMPPFSYRLVHGDLRLKTQEIASICSWSQAFRTKSVQSDSHP
jgi:heme-binding protein